MASVAGHAGCGQELLDNGAEIDYEDPEGKTALMQATVNNHHELVKVFQVKKSLTEIGLLGIT